MAPQAWALAISTRLAAALFCDRLITTCNSIALIKTRQRYVRLAYDPSCGSKKVIVKSSLRSRDDSKENQKAQRPDSAFESGGRPAAGMKSKV